MIYLNFSYFLGANSARGFYSLYDGFVKGAGDYLTVIKGGPGTGKSGFMRKIGAQAEKRGLDVEYVICSGDVNSLDGVYIPALKRGWTDGTAPHCADPVSFGVNGDYVNLGSFCSTPLNGEKCRNAERLFGEYRGHYAAAYEILSKADANSGQFSERNVSELANALADIIVSKSPSVDFRSRKCFLRCICGAGEVVLNNEPSKLCGELYRIDCAGFDSAVLSALCKSFGGIVCLSPLVPEKIDALLMPQIGVGILGSAFEVSNAQNIELSGGDNEDSSVIEAAVRELKTAKGLHDELEDIFKSETDFDALTKYTESYIDSLFKETLNNSSSAYAGLFML